MKFRVKGGHRQGGDKDLCPTCRHAIVQRGETLDDHRVFCRALGADMGGPRQVKPGIIECSTYDDKRYATLWDMKQMAWKLETGKGREIGFKPPKNQRRGYTPGEDPIDTGYDPVKQERVDLDD